MDSFRGQKKLGLRPDWSPLGVYFKIYDEYPHPFHMRIPPPPLWATKVPSWSSVMLSILRRALHFVSKELRAFGEYSVATKWRKYAIAWIMCVQTYM